MTHVRIGKNFFKNRSMLPLPPFFGISEQKMNQRKAFHKMKTSKVREKLISLNKKIKAP